MLQIFALIFVAAFAALPWAVCAIVERRERRARIRRRLRAIVTEG